MEVNLFIEVGIQQRLIEVYLFVYSISFNVLLSKIIRQPQATERGELAGVVMFVEG
jgi:hypothetical protein